MKHWIVAGVAASFIGVLGFQYYNRAESASCSSQGTVDTVKQIATKKLSSYYASDYLLKDMWSPGSRSDVLDAAIGGKLTFTLSAFRERGTIGQGLNCAAIVAVHAEGQPRSASLNAEYSVEPTSDGNAVVTARFLRN